MDNLRLHRELIFAGLLALALLLIIITAFGLLRTPRGRNKSPKLIVIIAANIFLLALIFYMAFPLLPNVGQEQSLKVANNFMNFLHIGDYQSAQTLITNAMRADDYASILPTLENPGNQPVSWKLEIIGSSPRSYVATGTVILPDGKEVPVSIHVAWKWQSASWKISSVLYNPYVSERNKDDIHFSLYSTDADISYNAITWILSFVSMLVTGCYVYKTRMNR